MKSVRRVAFVIETVGVAMGSGGGGLPAKIRLGSWQCTETRSDLISTAVVAADNISKALL